MIYHITLILIPPLISPGEGGGEIGYAYDYWQLWRIYDYLSYREFMIARLLEAIIEDLFLGPEIDQ